MRKRFVLTGESIAPLDPKPGVCPDSAHASRTPSMRRVRWRCLDLRNRAACDCAPRRIPDALSAIAAEQTTADLEQIADVQLAVAVLIQDRTEQTAASRSTIPALLRKRRFTS